MHSAFVIDRKVDLIFNFSWKRVCVAVSSSK